MQKWRRPMKCPKTGRRVKSSAVVQAKPYKIHGNTGATGRKQPRRTPRVDEDGNVVPKMRIGVVVPSGKVIHTAQSKTRTQPLGHDLLGEITKARGSDKTFLLRHLEEGG